MMKPKSKQVICKWCGHSKSITKDLENAYEQGINDAVEEMQQILHNIYTQNLYCLEDECRKVEMGYDCEDCVYTCIKQNLYKIKERHNE